MQHQLRLLRILISARNICHHLLQAIRPIEQHIGNGFGNMAALLFKVLDDVFKMVPQSSQPAQANNCARAFHGVGNALGYGQVFAIGLACCHFANQLNKPLRLLWRFLQEAVKELLVYIGGNFKRHIFRRCHNGALVFFACEIDLQRHGAKLVHDFQRAFLIQRMGCAAQIIKQTSRRRGIVEVVQVMHHQTRPAAQKGNHWLALGCG